MVTDELRRGGEGLTVLGLLMMVCGVLCIAAPFLAGVALVWILGGVFVFLSFATFGNAFREQAFWLGAGDTLAGLLYLAIGLILLFKTVAALAGLALVLAIFLFVRGAFQTSAGWRARPARGWRWILIGGVLSIVLGILLLAHWPLDGAYAVGILLGIDLLYTGSIIAFLGHHLRGAARALQGRS